MTAKRKAAEPAEPPDTAALAPTAAQNVSVPAPAAVPVPFAAFDHYRPYSSGAQLFSLPDALLARIIRLACASDERPPLDDSYDLLEAKLRSVVARSRPASSSEPWVDLWRLRRLRLVCRRLTELVEAGGVVPQARETVQLDSCLSSARSLRSRYIDAQATLYRAFKGAGRVSGIEDLELILRPPVGRGEDASFVFLAPLAQLRSLRSLRLHAGGSGGSASMCLGPEHLLPLAALTGLARLDLKGTPISLAALGALAPLPLTSLRAAVVCTAPNVADVLSRVARAFPRLQRLLLEFQPPSSHRGTAPRFTLPREALAPLASLASLRALGLTLSDGYDAALSSLAPLAGLQQLEHLAVPNGPLLNLRPLSSLTALRSLRFSGSPVRGDASFLEPLVGLEALALEVDTLFDPAGLLCLATRLRCLRLNCQPYHDDEAHFTRALVGALVRLTSLEAQDLTLKLPLAVFEALAGQSLSAWGDVSRLHLQGHPQWNRATWPHPTATRFLQHVAHQMISLRELAIGGQLLLPLPLPAAVAFGLRGRLRRLQTRDVDEHRPATHAAVIMKMLQAALGIRAEPYPLCRSDECMCLSCIS